MSSRLEALPGELLKYILEFLAIDLGYSNDSLTKSRLCRTSKHIRQATIPYLYRLFSKYAGSVPSFATKICAQPELAEHVRVLELVVSPFGQPVWPPKTTEQLDSFIDVFIKSLSVQDTCFYLNSLENGCAVAWNLLLICACNNLKELHFTTEAILVSREADWACACCADAWEWMRDFFSDPEVRKQYGQLQRIALRDEGWRTRATHQDIIPMLLLPALRIFECAEGITPGSLGLPVGFRPSTTLQEIHLDKTTISDSALRDIVSATKVLKVLKICWERPPYEDLDISPSVIVTALEQHKDHLEELELVGRPMDDWLSPNDPLISSLQDFAALRTLDLDEDLLLIGLSWDSVKLSSILPSSLSTLKINTGDSPTCAVLSKICLALSTAGCSSLNDVWITFYEMEDHSAIWGHERRLNQELSWSPGPFSAGDVGCFKPVYTHECGRVALHCWDSTAELMAGLGSLLSSDYGWPVLKHMLRKQAPVSFDRHKRNVVVLGAIHDVFEEEDLAFDVLFENVEEIGDVFGVRNLGLSSMFEEKQKLEVDVIGLEDLEAELVGLFQESRHWYGWSAEIPESSW